MEALHIQVVDPSAYTPAYDHSLCAALAAAGADVELVTSRFRHATPPRPGDYRLVEQFYRRSSTSRLSKRARRALKLAEHGSDMLRYRHRARQADVVHYQWLPVEPVDVHLLPRVRPRLLTAHDIVPREPRWGQVAATRKLIQKMDAVIVHSEHGAIRLSQELGADPARVHVIPHGAFDYLTHLPDEAPLAPELAAVAEPVILFFGQIRPYKGLDVLLAAFRDLAHADAELWVIGAPRIPLEPLRRAAAEAPGKVRFDTRFLSDEEIPAYFRRADLVVLPYREIDQSGVLATALAFGKPIVMSAVGAFPEVVEQHGAGRLVPPGDVATLATTMNDLLSDRSARNELAAAAKAAAAGPYSWTQVAEKTMALYRRLLRIDDEPPL